MLWGIDSTKWLIIGLIIVILTAGGIGLWFLLYKKKVGKALEQQREQLRLGAEAYAQNRAQELYREEKKRKKEEEEEEEEEEQPQPAANSSTLEQLGVVPDSTRFRSQIISSGDSKE